MPSVPKFKPVVPLGWNFNTIANNEASQESQSNSKSILNTTSRNSGDLKVSNVGMFEKSLNNTIKSSSVSNSILNSLKTTRGYKANKYNPKLSSSVLDGSKSI
jgi:hypothetical protein